MRSFTLFCFALAATLLFYAGWWKSSLLPYLDYKIYDRLIASMPSPKTGSTVVVKIDEASLQAFGQWPWPRVLTAELFDKIGEGKPAAIVADMMFPEQDRTSPSTVSDFYRNFFNLQITFQGLPENLYDNDRLFAEVLKKHHVILPVFFDPTVEMNQKCQFRASAFAREGVSTEDFYPVSNMVCNLPTLQHSIGGIGHIHAMTDKDGILRRLPLIMRYDEKLVPILGVAAIASLDPDIALKRSSRFVGDIKVEAANHTFTMDQKSEVLIRFYPESWYETVSANDLLNGRYDINRLRGKFVFIGATAVGLDTWYTLSDGTSRPGVYANTTVVENFFNNDLGVQPSFYPVVNLCVSFMIACVLMVMMIRKKYLYVLAVVLIVLVLETVLTALAIRENIYISSGYLIVPLVSYLFLLANLMFLIDYRTKKKYYEDMRRANLLNRRLETNLEYSKAELEYQKEILFHQSKLAAMGEMIENIAHQWRQPLNMLGLNIQDLEEAYKYGELDERYITKMVHDSMDQIMYMSKTVDDFRDFLNPNQNMASFDVNQAVEEAFQLLSSTLFTLQIGYEIICKGKSPKVFGVANEFKQVIINLINNTKDVLDESDRTDGKITITIDSDDDVAYVWFDDNGGGIPEEVISRIFESHVTTKGEKRGSGIGLYMSHVIIHNKMHGTIEASNTAEGARFCITLPLYQEEVSVRPSIGR